ncbi:MAG: tyrosine-type recombinase/integrase, partial [Thermoplasmatales archaeon]
LFTTKKGRMSYQFARNIIKKIAYRSGVPKFHAHAARHWNATALLREGNVDIRKVQIHLGHGSLSSTQRYTHLTTVEVADEVREKMEKFFREVEIKMKSANPNGTAPEPSGTAEI